MLESNFEIHPEVSFDSRVDVLIQVVQKAVNHLSSEDVKNLPSVNLLNYPKFVQCLCKQSLLSSEEKRRLMLLPLMDKQQIVIALKSKLTLRGYRL